MMAHDVSNRFSSLNFHETLSDTRFIQAKFIGGTMLGQSLGAVASLVLLLLQTPSAAQERPKVYLGASSKTLEYSPLWVGAKRGFFEQQGLDVQLLCCAACR
jgi:hypothetical protein